MTLGVDVVVVSYERRDLLLQCCQAALQAGEVRVVVVDNASSDGSAEAVRARFPEVTILPQSRNRGFATAVNLGVAVGENPYVLILNADALIDEPALAALLAALEADPLAAGAGPRLRGSAGELELSVGRTMTPWSEIRFKVLERFHSAGRGLATAWLERTYAKAKRVNSLTAACLLLRRNALQQVGGLDERFFLYAEDVDLCRRIVSTGSHLLFVPGAEVAHARGASGKLDPSTTERAYRRSQLAFYRKHNSAFWTLGLRCYLRARYSVRALFGPAAQRDRARQMLSWLRSAQE